jgi:aminoglycoside phosphotransferase (APT) family kinase protein
MGMAMGQVPTTTEDASAEFVTEALRSTGAIDADTVVAEIEHNRIGEGVGLICELARLTLRYGGPAQSAPSSVILKVPSNLPENRGVGDQLRMYEREGRFYEHVGRNIAVRTPACLGNHIDADTGEFALILEDFGGRTMVSQIVGMDAERTQQAVRAIARVHAQFWDSPAIHAMDWMPRAIDPEVMGLGQIYRACWPAFLALLGEDLPDGAVALGERVGATWETVAQQMFDKEAVTMCHGDYRADNLMFDDTTGGVDHVGVLDWQAAYRGGGVGDVAYLISQSTTAETRRAHDRVIVSAWYDELCSSLGGAPDGYSRADAWDGYRRASASMTAVAVIAGAQLDPANERGRELVHDMAVRSFSAALELDAASLLPDSAFRGTSNDFDDPGPDSSSRSSVGDGVVESNL